MYSSLTSANVATSRVPDANTLAQNVNDGKCISSSAIAGSLCLIPPSATNQQLSSANATRAVNSNQSNNLWIENGNTNYLAMNIAAATAAAHRTNINVLHHMMSMQTPSRSTTLTFSQNYHQTAESMVMPNSNIHTPALMSTASSTHQAAQAVQHGRSNQTMEPYQSEMYVQSQSNPDIPYLNAANNGHVYSQL